jgi:hypothetical protein
MNWAWASSPDQTVSMWLTLAVAGFFGIVVLITLLRAEKSVGNVALAVMTLLAIGIASAATIRGFDSGGRSASGETPSSLPPPMLAALPALSCIDDLAGEAVLTACEKSLFGSAESTAAALSYAAAQITRLTSFGDVAAADKNLAPELQMLRRAVERDRYGLMAYVLMARDHCTPSDCAAFRSLTDRQQVASNMDQRIYDGLVMRYAASWNAPAAAVAPVAGFAPSMPTGRPTNAEFPTAASTPPVSIMTPEPTTAPALAAPRSSASVANAPSPRPPAAAHAPAAAAPALAAAKKQPAPKPRAAAPVQLSPAAPVAAAPAPEAVNE